ncbi:FAD-dependent oxidoreductase [Clostridium sp. AWRP]|uniref:phytoene desaturase family protein n=1 Tax=Clostridium sp. AWRP TaxID=2212991 RepID=UPI000FDB5516|nr:FAD-dependent oxidoreductase [Clostridium sp. AWRP]AZV58554.1 NAD(P)/FAD-dependent oxidoreductase [Clostridium sp. AWRP]
MEKKIIIIGAGISGLSAGCYGQMNGYETEIFEMQKTPGGLCTSWNRKDYIIDGCIDWVVGSNPDSILYDFWKEIGAFDNIELINHDYVMNVEDGNGKKLILYSNVDNLEKHLLELSPKDSVVIKEFTDAIRKSSFFSKSKKTIFNDKFLSMTMYDFLKEFKSKFLKEALSVCLLPLRPKEYSVGGLIFRLSLYNRKDAFWPVGGSLAFARNIEKKYISLDGKIKYGKKVQEVIVKNNKAIGIKLSNGIIHYADYIVSAIDGYSTIFNLLKGDYLDNGIKNLFNNKIDLPTSMQVSLGINCDLSDEPHSIAIKLDNPLTVGNITNTHLYFKHFSYDSIISSPNKSVITSIIRTEYKYWKNLYKDIEMYKLEKEKICMKFIEIVEKRFPETKGKIEITDVATPITYHRYTDVWKGSYMGWWAKSKSIIPQVLFGLENFYIAGQWTQASGGVSGSMMSGRSCINKIRMDDGKR